MKSYVSDSEEIINNDFQTFANFQAIHDHFDNCSNFKRQHCAFNNSVVSRNVLGILLVLRYVKYECNFTMWPQGEYS